MYFSRFLSDLSFKIVDVKMVVNFIIRMFYVTQCSNICPYLITNPGLLLISTYQNRNHVIFLEHDSIYQFFQEDTDFFTKMI